MVQNINAYHQDKITVQKLLSFAEAPGSGDRWQMDRLENPKRFVMTLRWLSFEEVSIYFRRKNIFVESVHNKKNILKLE